MQSLKNFLRSGKHAQEPSHPCAYNPNSVPRSIDIHHHHHHHHQPAEPKHVDGPSISHVTAESHVAKNKFPVYPGLERWELLEKMGDGAFSNVYRARDLRGTLGVVAIKVVRKYEMNNMQRANILKEVQIMRQLDHPNIIRLLDFSESRQYYYIVLELAPGGELFHQIVRLTYFSEDLSRHVIVQVAKALEYLHEEKGVVHRDIKPENILFSPIPFVPSKVKRPAQPGDEDKMDEGEFIPGKGAGGIGQIKIADFGLSKVVWDTQTRTPCGTVGYTAPEIVKDERYSKSVDMWALGCVLYTLLCGFPPFYDESIEALTEKVAKGQFTFLSPWWDDISKSAQDLISHLLTVDPEKRYTIREFLSHPWIRGADVVADGKDNASVQTNLGLPLDSTKIIDGGTQYDFRSPCAVNLREVFDVSYAVHRQEEEAFLRKQAGAKAGAAPDRSLDDLSEEPEDEEEQAAVMAGDNGQGAFLDPTTEARLKAQSVAAYANAHAKELERTMRNVQLGDSNASKSREKSPKPVQPTERGYGQHSAAVTAAARQQVRERHRKNGVFELDLGAATLLGRRGMKPAAAVGGQ